ncbi:MAG: ATP-binding protein [Pirellulaceae bacterium]|nr:ATP-binding protein [Pirellulaceae bacterium]
MTQPRWIAYELHDGLMQWVIGARMHMAALVAAVKEQRPIDNLDSNLSQILAYLNQATEEGRHLIRFVEGLESDEQANVVAALEGTAEILSRKTHDGKPQVSVHLPQPGWPELEPALAWSVVRIVQQAAMNAVRHSGAEEVSINMGWTSDASQMHVVVSDNGQGFDPAAQYPGHFGLKSMRQRSREAGLNLEIKSSPTGTDVHLTIPPP